MGRMAGPDTILFCGGLGGSGATKKRVWPDPFGPGQNLPAKISQARCPVFEARCRRLISATVLEPARAPVE